MPYGGEFILHFMIKGLTNFFDQIFANSGLEVFLRLLCQWFFILETKQSTGTDIGLLKFVVIENNMAMAL